MKGPANQQEREKNPKPRLFCFWHVTGVGCNLCFTCQLASLFLRIKTNRKRQIQLTELIAPGQPQRLWQSATAPLGYRDTNITELCPPSIYTQEGQIPHHPHGGNMGKTQELPQRKGLRSQARWQGLSCCWKQPGHWKWRGSLYSWTSQGTFGSQQVWTANTQRWELLPK